MAKTCSFGEQILQPSDGFYFNNLWTILVDRDEQTLIDPCCPNHPNGFLIDVAFPSLLSSHLRGLRSKDTVIRSRCLIRCVQIVRLNFKCMDRSVVQKEIVEPLASYVFQQWDHFMEVVRLQAVELFEELLVFHINSCSICVPFPSILCPWVSESVVKPIFSPAHQQMRSPYWMQRILLRKSNLESFLKYISCRDEVSLQETEGYLLVLINKAGDQALAPVVSELFSSLAMKLKDTELAPLKSAGFDYRMSFLLPIMQKLSGPSDQERFAIKERFLPILLKDAEVMSDCLWAMERMSDSCQIAGETNSEGFLRAQLTLATMGVKFQHQIGLCDRKHSIYPSWRNFIEKERLVNGLLHLEREVSLTSIQLLLEHPRTTLAFDEEELSLCKVYLVTNANEQGPANRQKILTAFKKMFIRMRDSGQIAFRNPNSPGEVDSELISLYKEFFNWLFDFCIRGCSLESCYGRRAVALGILDLIYCQDHLKTKDKRRLFEHLDPINWLSKVESSKAIISLLDDTYDQTQMMALKVLSMLPTDSLPQEFLDEFRRDTRELTRSNRPQDTYAGAIRHLFLCSYSNSISWIELLNALGEQLKEQQKVAERDVIEAAHSASMHGILHAIDAVLRFRAENKHSLQNSWQMERESFQSTITDLIRSSLLQISELIAPVVHNMSPEGCLPGDMQALFQVNHKTDESSREAQKLKEKSDAKWFSAVCQEVLVCCWRTQKEISSIFATLIGEYQDVLVEDWVSAISDYFWTQLTECKHRGAFETAYGGFIKLCQYLWTNDSGIRVLERWLDVIIVDNLLGDQAAMKKLCSTRRSAGIPFLIQGILANEPKSRNFKSLELTFAYLLAIAGNRPHELPSEHQVIGGITVESRVHACNILKALYRDNRLGESVMPWTPSGLTVAVSAFADLNSWAIRNSASQLFSALVNRIFGVPRIKDGGDSSIASKKNCMSSTEFFMRAPELHSFMISWIHKSDNKNGGSGNGILEEWSLFPVLILLSRLYPSHRLDSGASSTFPLEPFLNPLLRIALSSRILKVRELAAAALTSLITEDGDGKVKVAEACLRTMQKGTRHNAIHGSLKILTKLSVMESSGPPCISGHQLLEIAPKVQIWPPINVKLLIQLLRVQSDEWKSKNVAVILGLAAGMCKILGQSYAVADPENCCLEIRQSTTSLLSLKPLTQLLIETIAAFESENEAERLGFLESAKLEETIHGIGMEFYYQAKKSGNLKTLLGKLPKKFIETAISMFKNQTQADRALEEKSIRKSASVFQSIVDLNPQFRQKLSKLWNKVFETLSTKSYRTKTVDAVMSLKVDLTIRSDKKGSRESDMNSIVEWICRGAAPEASLAQRMVTHEAIQKLIRLNSNDLGSSENVALLCIATLCGLQDEVGAVREFVARSLCQSGIPIIATSAKGRLLNPTLCLEIILANYGKLLSADDQARKIIREYLESSSSKQKYAKDNFTHISDSELEKGAESLFDRSEANLFEEPFLLQIFCENPGNRSVIQKSQSEWTSVIDMIG